MLNLPPETAADATENDFETLLHDFWSRHHGFSISTDIIQLSQETTPRMCVRASIQNSSYREVVTAHSSVDYIGKNIRPLEEEAIRLAISRLPPTPRNEQGR